MYTKLQNIAALDELTGIYNRKFGIQRLNEEIARTKRYKMEYHIMILDIDHFKEINDTYGHIVGDFILSEVAKIIKKMFRKEDVFFRYGGEEFVIGMIASLDNVARKSELLRKSIASQIFICKDIQIKITVSIGISTIPVETVSCPDDLIEDADKSLYYAKNNGRNQVCANCCQIHLYSEIMANKINL